jgi:hypothetical protein
MTQRVSQYSSWIHTGRYLSYEQARDIQAEAENHLQGLEFEVDSHSVLDSCVRLAAQPMIASS